MQVRGRRHSPVVMNAIFSGRGKTDLTPRPVQCDLILDKPYYVCGCGSSPQHFISPFLLHYVELCRGDNAIPLCFSILSTKGGFARDAERMAPAVAGTTGPCPPGCAAKQGSIILMDGVIDSRACGLGARRWRNPRLDRFIAVRGDESPSAFISGVCSPFHLK